MRPPALLAVVVPVLLLLGCGDDSDYANKPRPPAPINVTAAITDSRVEVSPHRFGAGPIVMIISNQSSDAQRVTFETDEIGGSGPGIRQTTSPINPRGTATLKVDVSKGSYALHTADDGIRPAAVSVGEPRKSAQNDLLQP